MTTAHEHAKEAIEHANHGAGHAPDPFARNVAVLVAVLAAALALFEMGEKAAQNAYLTHHITASDDWAFYQAKNIRSTVYALHADLLETLAPPTDAAARARIAAARAEARRLDDDEKTQGRKQLGAKAQASERARETAFHRYHLFEGVVGALQIAIVLASAAIVARARPLAWLSALLGAGAGVMGAAVALHLI
jgi:hypothetical protein